MAIVRFTSNLARHVDCQEVEVSGNTLALALTEVFTRFPRVRGYILDDQGCIRKHMVIFIDGTQTTDRMKLSDPVSLNSQIYIMQALSGGV